MYGTYKMYQQGLGWHELRVPIEASQDVPISCHDDCDTAVKFSRWIGLKHHVQ